MGETPVEESVRLLLLCDDLSAAREGAAYFCACRAQTGRGPDAERDWDELDDMLSEIDLEVEEAAGAPPDTDRTLLLADTETLFAEGGPAQDVLRRREAGFIRLTAAAMPHVLFFSERGEVLDERLGEFLPACAGGNLLIALLPDQQKPALMRRLCFELGFSAVRLGSPSEQYQKRQFSLLAQQRGLKLSPSLPFQTVVRQLRQMQGKRFSDLDFARILDYARRTYGAVSPLTLRQLTFPDMLGDNGEDIYAREAVNAIVRHMELSPGTVVIFATYPGEMDTLLGQNPGLSSRFAHCLNFPDCPDEQLCDILVYQARAFHYGLPEDYRALAGPFFRKLRERQGDRFGNGREARRLLMAAIENLAVRAAADENVPIDTLDSEDLQRACDTLLAEGRTEEKRKTIGF